MVMVKYEQVEESCVIAKLMEYEDKVGMLTQAEFTRGERQKYYHGVLKAKYFNKKEEVCKVLRVDKQKGFIDLTKKEISQEDIQKAS